MKVNTPEDLGLDLDLVQSENWWTLYNRWLCLEKIDSKVRMNILPFILWKAESTWENPNHWPTPITSAAYYKIQVFLNYELLRQVNEHVGDTVFKVLLWK